MIKDYAKHRPKFIAKRHNRYPAMPFSSKGLPSWAWVLFGLIFGITISSILFWKLSPARNAALSAVSSLESSKALAKKDQALSRVDMPKKLKKVKQTTSDIRVADLHPIKQAAVPESRFDFYTLLPTMSIDPLSTESIPAPKKSILPYILQAGSFKTHEQANQLRSALALQGLEAHIQTVRINPSESWYRVYIGPFNTKADALGVQQNLENGYLPGSDRFNSVILKMRVS